MKELKFYIIIAVLLLYVFLTNSCYIEKESSSLLEKAESLIYTNPDSALFLLQKINPNIESVSVKAKYALLLTQAKDKNYVLHTDDSLINIAVNYYDSIGDIEEAAKAHYYLARVYQDMQNEVGAVCEYLTALPLAERHKGSTILYLLYGNLGQIYFQQDLLSKADSLFALSESIAIQKNDSFNLTMGLVARGNVCLQRREHENAMNFFERALAIAKNMGNTNAQTIIFNSMAAFYTSIDHPEKTIEYSKRGLSYKIDSLSSARLYLLEGNALMQLQKYDSTKYVITKSLITSSVSTKATAYLLLTDIERKQGDLNKALSFQDHYIECLDSMDLMKSRIRSVISKGDKMLHFGKYESLLKNYRLYIGGLLFTLLLLVIYWTNKRYKYCNKINVLILKKESLEHQLETLSVMQKRLLKKEQELDLLQEFVGTVEEDKAKLYYLTNQINILRKENKDFFLNLLANTKSYKLLLQLIQKKRDNCKCRDSFSEKEWDWLLQDIDYLSNGFVERLKIQIPLLSKSDIRFCCLFKIGISYADMALAFDRTLDAMYKKRNVILVKKVAGMSKFCSLEELIDSI